MPGVIEQHQLDTLSSDRQQALLLECVSDRFAPRERIYGRAARISFKCAWGSLDGATGKHFVNALLEGDDDAAQAALAAKAGSRQPLLAAPGMQEPASFTGGQ